MAPAWHREEPRDVRPFFNARQAENALVDTGIRLSKGGAVLTDTVFDLEEVDFQALTPVIYPSLADRAIWMPDGLTADDLELVLVARHSLLKKSVILERHPIRDELPAEWRVGPELMVELGGGRNAEFTIAICLVADGEPSPGSPFIAGHWLALKSFGLRSRVTPALFDVRTRTDGEWIAAGYPAKTLFIVDYAGGIEVEAEEGDSIATIYLHADAYDKGPTCRRVWPFSCCLGLK